MKIIKFIISMCFLIYSASYAQNTYPQEEKDWLIASLDSSFEQSGIIENIIDHRVYEAVPKLEQNFWWRNCEDQILYLRALTVLGSDKSYEYTKAFLDSLDNSTSDKYNNCGYKLGTKVETIYLLYKMNDFSRVDEVFELLDKDKANDRLLPYSIQLLPYIYKNIPSHKERAKQELINAVRNSTDEYAIFSSTLDLTQAFGEEELDTMIELFKTLNVPQAKRAILQLYFTKVKDKFDLRGLLQETLPVETSSMLRLYYIKVMLRGFSTTADYKFVQDYLKNNPDDSLSTVINSELNRFISYPPKTVSTLTMLDTLISYTNQCYGYEWLKDEAYKNELLNKITTAKSYLNASDSVNCAIEIQTFQNSVNQVYQDSAGSYPKYVSNEGYKFLYYYAQYILDKLPAPFPVNDIIAKVRVKVIKKKNGNLKYKYKLKNKPESTQDIALFYVKEKTDSLTLSSPSGWRAGELTESNLISFSADSEGVEIPPGDVQRGFTVKGKRLPYISNYYIQSSRVLVDTADIYGNSYNDLTLSPALAPSPFIALEFMDTLISYNDQAYNLGWIKNENVYNKFNIKLNKAKTKLENGKERKAKEILREFVQLVRRKWCNRKITSEALALLKFNAQYLIKHVGPPNLEDNLAGVTLEGVERLDGENRRYKYNVHNSVNNPDKLSAFYVKESVDNYTAKVPEDWTQTAIDSLNLVSYSTEVNSAMIKPDKKKNGYSIKVESLPVIMPFYLLVKDQSSEADTILYNSITGFTLGPESLPGEFVGLDQVDNLYEHVEESNDMGWIMKESVYDNLIDRVNTIINKVEMDKTQQAKNKLQDFVDYVQDKYDQDKLTKEARILLKQNANYIKRNL